MYTQVTSNNFHIRLFLTRNIPSLLIRPNSSLRSPRLLNAFDSSFLSRVQNQKPTESLLDDLEFERSIKGTLYPFDYRSCYILFSHLVLFSFFIGNRSKKTSDLFIISHVENLIFTSFKALYLCRVFLYRTNFLDAF